MAPGLRKEELPGGATIMVRLRSYSTKIGLVGIGIVLGWMDKETDFKGLRAGSVDRTEECEGSDNLQLF